MVDREQEYEEILNRLRSGQPLGRIDRAGVIQPVANPMLIEAKQFLDGSRSRRSGPLSDREVIWLMAPRGGGKTETLASIEDYLTSIGVESPSDDTGQEKTEKGDYIVVWVDLKLPEAVSSGSGLQSVIFNRAITVSSSPMKSEIDKLAKSLTEMSKLEEIRGNLIVGDLNMGAKLLGVSAPGSQTLGQRLWSASQRRWKFREANIKKQLENRGITAPDAVNLITQWIRYSDKPNEKNWRRLRDVFGALAASGHLFPALCATLQACKYTTIVLLFDEADQLLNISGLPRLFENLYDPPPASAPYQYKIDMLFVLAGTEACRKLVDESKYAGFPRRFMGSTMVRDEPYILPLPRVKEQMHYADDFDHAIKKIKDLMEKSRRVTIPDLTDEEEKELRAKLIAQNANKPTWYDLWASVYSRYDAKSTER